MFISRIEVFGEKKVYVQFRGEDEFHKMLVLQEYVAEKMGNGEEVMV